VTMCNALMALVKLDKRYYLVHTTLELLVSEGWQFLQLTGKYSGFHTQGVQPTHENQFIFFCQSVEKIRMRQVEEEYYKLAEMHPQQGQQGAQGQAQGSRPGAAGPAAAAVSPPSNPFANLIPPTPMRGELARLPADVLRTVQEELSRSQIENGAPADAALGTGGPQSNEESGEQSAQHSATAAPVPVHSGVHGPRPGRRGLLRRPSQSVPAPVPPDGLGATV
jgi:hypothetical protein